MSRNLSIAMDYLERLAGLDPDGALELVADHATFMDPDGSSITKEDVRARFAGVGELFASPFEQSIIGTTVQGRRVAIEATGSAKLTNGNTYNNVYHFLFEIDDGLIVAFKEYCNTKAIDAFI